ncbi:MAG: nucleotidyltransferase domain-containing protein [Nanoarchaeota archaeon]|nr:nucleotidyltransferase domain-containing protein [Nanoarchaeota archaeon]
MLLNKFFLAVLSEFCLDYFAGLTGSQIAKRTNLNQKSVSSVLLSLEKMGILKCATQGRNKVYSLNNWNSDLLINVLSATELMRTYRFQKKHSLIRQVIKDIMPHCRGNSAIFGSYAKCTEKKDSDLDVLVVGAVNFEKIEEISETYSIDINIQQFTRRNFKKALRNSDILVKEVIKHHIFIKDAEGFVSLVMKYGQNKMVLGN